MVDNRTPFERLVDLLEQEFPKPPVRKPRWVAAYTMLTARLFAVLFVVLGVAAWNIWSFISGVLYAWLILSLGWWTEHRS